MVLDIVMVGLCVISLVAFFKERGKRKQMQLKLGQERNELIQNNAIAQAVLKNVHAFVLLIDSDFKVLDTNYYSRTGTPKRAEKKRVGDLLQCRNALSAAGGCGTHEQCGSCPIRAAIRQSFLDRNSFTDLEASLELQISDETVIVCDTEISGAYLTLDGSADMVLTVHDVTKQKKAEFALVEAKEKAENADCSKSVFLANMSHEIRTPLNAIIGFSQLLATAATDEEKSQYLEILETNGELLLQLINDILDLSKIEAGTLEFVYSDVDINLLISDLERLFSMKVKEADGHTQIIKVLSATTCILHTDRNRIAQVVSNFISNAVKFTPEGSVRFGYEPRETELYFYVADTGSGIPESHLATVFERFVKLEKSKNGTGLGLSICRTIVEKLGGTIGVESVCGSGSTFWFTLPFHLDSKPNITVEKPVEIGMPAAKEEAFIKKEGNEKKTVLIAEDMEDNYRLCEAALSPNYHLLWAHNGAEAISLFLQHQPDLILMDLRMPEVDGYEATQAIRQLSTVTPIVALTAYAYPEDRAKVLLSGFTDFMTKPVSSKVLLEKVRSLLADE